MVPNITRKVQTCTTASGRTSPDQGDAFVVSCSQQELASLAAAAGSCRQQPAAVNIWAAHLPSSQVAYCRTTTGEAAEDGISLSGALRFIISTKH